jgi:hypothetical protein
MAAASWSWEVGSHFWASCCTAATSTAADAEYDLLLLLTVRIIAPTLSALFAALQETKALLQRLHQPTAETVV